MDDRITRRTFTGSLLAACSGSLARAEQTMELPSFGTLHRDRATRDAYARDEGGIVQLRPRAVLEPRAEEDVQHAIRFARGQALRVVARGQGHQPLGQAQIDDGLLIDMRTLNRVHALRDGALEVDAGASWQKVIDAALARGQTPPVLTNYTGLTVGGTLAIGGVGLASAEHGAQVDCVRALRVITGEGACIECTRGDALFAAMCAGQGACGIIARATLELTPAPASVHETMLQFDDAPSLLASLASTAVGLIVRTSGGWSYLMQAIGERPRGRELQSRELPYAEYARGTAYESLGRPAPSLGLLVPGPRAAEFLLRLLPRLTPDDLGAATALRVFSWPRTRFAAPLLRMPSCTTVVYIAILRNEVDDVARMLTGNRVLYDEVRALGGVLYPFAALALGKQQWREHYGEVWPLLEAAKRRHDPDGVFASALFGG